MATMLQLHQLPEGGGGDTLFASMEADVALWDNRCLQHFAIWDYWPNERKGHRVSILGDRPFFDPHAPDAGESSLRVSRGQLAPKPGVI